MTEQDPKHPDNAPGADRIKKRVAQAYKDGCLSDTDKKWREEVHKAYTTRVGTKVGAPQVNRILVEQLAVLASVAYSNLVPDIEPVAHHELVLPAEVTPTQAAASMRLLLMQWTQRPDTRTAIEKALTSALIDRDAAFEVALSKVPGQPMDRVQIIPLTNLEAFWDRKAKSYETMAFAGKMTEEPLAKLQERYPDCTEKLADLTDKSSGTKLRRIEFYDYDGTWEVDLTSKSTDEGSGTPLDEEPAEPQRQTVPGRMMVLAVPCGSDMNESQMVLLREGPVPYTEVDGRPLKTILPLLLLSSPDEVLGGLSLAEALYPPVAMMNRNRVWADAVANAEASFASLLMYDPAQVDEKMRATMFQQVEPRAVARKEQERGDQTRPVFDRPPQMVTSGVIRDAAAQAEADADRIGTVAPLSYGDTMKYAKATAASLVGQYNETTIARIRHALDLTIARLLPMVTRLIAIDFDDAANAAQMPDVVDPLDVAQPVMDRVRLSDPSGKSMDCARQWFDHPWRYVVSETAQTPMAESAARGDLLQVYPVIRAACEDMGNPNPYVAAAAEAFLEVAFRLFRLPREFEPSRLRAAAKTKALEAPAPPLSGGPGGMSPPGGLPDDGGF